MKRTTTILICATLFSVNTLGADLILNEYNAVDDTEFLGGGNASTDAAGGRASDTYFGRVAGNGGNWFEVVVIKDYLDIRGWQLDIYEAGMLAKTLTLSTNPVWKELRAGTIITVSEQAASDVSYNPAAGDWWINVQAHEHGDGLYIDKLAFPVSATDWQLRIRNQGGQVVFGPAGEGISPTTGIGRFEVFRLEEDPNAAVSANSTNYDDGDDCSTFGAPNCWGIQNYGRLRPFIHSVQK